MAKLRRKNYMQEINSVVGTNVEELTIIENHKRIISINKNVRTYVQNIRNLYNNYTGCPLQTYILNKSIAETLRHLLIFVFAN